MNGICMVKTMCNVSGRISHDVNSVFKLTICCSKGIPSLCARQLSHDQVRQVDITVTNTIFVWDIEFQSGTSFDLYGFYSCTLSQKDVHQTMVGVHRISFVSSNRRKRGERLLLVGILDPFLDSLLGIL